MFGDSLLLERHRTAELMDQPGVTVEELRHAHKTLARVNQLSLTASQLWNEIDLWRCRSGVTQLNVLDVACGAGDLLRSLELRAFRKGISFYGHGIDINPDSILIAREQTAGDSNVSYSVGDALNTISTQYNVIVSTLFLHHLTQTEAVDFLRSIWKASNGIVLIHDLRRSASGYALAWLGTRLLSNQPMIRVDGLKSVRAAFSIPEIKKLLSDAHISNGILKTKFPRRLLLSIEPKNSGILT